MVDKTFWSLKVCKEEYKKILKQEEVGKKNFEHLNYSLKEFDFIPNEFKEKMCDKVEKEHFDIMKRKEEIIKDAMPFFFDELLKS